LKLKLIENRLAQKVNKKICEKVFFRWFDGYYGSIDKTYFPYIRKKKV
jgi:hypothetical protein